MSTEQTIGAISMFKSNPGHEDQDWPPSNLGSTAAAAAAAVAGTITEHDGRTAGPPRPKDEPQVA